ncbi:molybdenum cofactor cytidylyltransferase [Pseudomonas duriflava]|uniref:Molybdenum cofactor cytidylyltransferase n=1 Tax=Pseudomonas duriflava TaxID=459528 RepID=A0A562Q2N9_9PSED|nr:nucleotidyltransferase family protein [Pseudomonas duriflava]TWI50939.1 molybdenum cofactor cytidylyltransferase [Pseudomonas duriflava]
MADTLCVIVMAAGQGSRFRAQAGTDKLLATCVGLSGEAGPVLQHTLRSLVGIGDRRLVVTRPDNADVAALARAEGFAILEVATCGMGETLAQAVAAEPDHRGWLIALGDMPFIRPQTLQQVAALIAPDEITVPQAAGRYGNPVGFGRDYYTALCRLSGDRGGRVLFEQGRLRCIKTDDPGIFQDVDTPADL